MVPFTVTRDDVADLNLKTKGKYRLWYYFDQVQISKLWREHLWHEDHARVCIVQPGGSVQEYNGLTMFTIRDAGHMFPVRQPEKSLYVLKQFLAGKGLRDKGFARDYTVV